MAYGLVLTFHYVLDARDDGSYDAHALMENRPKGFPTTILPANSDHAFQGYNAADYGPAILHNTTHEYTSARTLAALRIVEANDVDSFEVDEHEVEVNKVALHDDHMFDYVRDDKDLEDETPEEGASRREGNRLFDEAHKELRNRKRRNMSSKSNKFPFSYQICYGRDDHVEECFSSICIVACLKGHELNSDWPEKNRWE